MINLIRLLHLLPAPTPPLKTLPVPPCHSPRAIGMVIMTLRGRIESIPRKLKKGKKRIILVINLKSLIVDAGPVIVEIPHLYVFLTDFFNLVIG